MEKLEALEEACCTRDLRTSAAAAAAATAAAAAAMPLAAECDEGGGEEDEGGEELPEGRGRGGGGGGGGERLGEIIMLLCVVVVVLSGDGAPRMLLKRMNVRLPTPNGTCPRDTLFRKRPTLPQSIAVRHRRGRRPTDVRLLLYCKRN